jgi:hypothetical protein
MKKITILFIVFCITFITYAQENRGLDNRFYIRLGYAKPTSSCLGADQWPLGGEVKRTGGMFELGSIFMLNNLDLGDGLRLGINVDYVEFAYLQFTVEDEFYGDEYALYSGLLSSKVGPSLSYNPVSKLVFDAFFKAKIAWVGGGYISADDEFYDEKNYIGYMGFGFSTGVNIRFGALIVGFDYNSCGIKLEDRDISDEYLGNIFDFSDDSDKSKMKYFSISLGVNF